MPDGTGPNAPQDAAAGGPERDPSGTGGSGGVLARRPAEVDLGPLPRRLGRYEVLERIGSGGMGTVFRARQLPIDRIVALKVLSPDLAGDRRYIRRFVREARAAGSLNHPNAVLVHDVGRVEGHPYICMEHVDGTTVERMLRERGRLAPDEAIGIAVDVARALEKAHRAGIVHRDIKPDNILVDRRGVVKLADLGLARTPSPPGTESVTREAVGMGTPCYMAVEQARDARHADARSDIYSLGATLYHMVTGRVPFDGDTAVDILMHAAEDDLKSPAELVPGMSDSFVRVIERMMAKDAGSRHQDASSLLADLESVQNELAGLGPARLAGAAEPARPPEGPGQLLVHSAVALCVLVAVGLIALALAGGGRPPSPPPTFELPPPRAADAGPAVREATGRAGEGALSRAEGLPPVKGNDHARKPLASAPAHGVTSEEDAPRREERATIREASRRAHWYERAGRYGDAAAHLRDFAARAAREGDRDRTLAALKGLYSRAEEGSAGTLARAKGLFAAGRHQRGVSLLEWALGVWGLPVLEARAEAALDEARRELAARADSNVARAKAEEIARTGLARAEALARRRSYRRALEIVNEALAAAGEAGGPGPAGPTVSELERRGRVFEALGAAHAAAVSRLASPTFGVPAREVFPDWAQHALIARADPDGIQIELPGTRDAWAGRRWADLTPVEYARLAAACARGGSPEEVMGAGLAWLEAGRPDEAMRLWKTCPLPKGTTSHFLEAGTGRAAVEDALRRARGLDAAGRQCEALAALAPAVEPGLADPAASPRLGRLIQSLARDVEGSAGLAGGTLRGPARALEISYDFSRKDWRGDWKSSAGRLRQAEHAVVSPSGGLCSLEFEGPFVSNVEVTVSLRMLEETGSGVEVAFVPEAEDAAPAATCWATTEGLAKSASGTFAPLVRRPLDVVFSRRWEELSFRAVPSERGSRPGAAATGFPGGSDPAAAPAGPERVVVTLVGWVELRGVRLRGVLDPGWLLERRRSREAEAGRALALAREETDPALRARRLEEVRAKFPACRGVGLRATREAARAHAEAGDASRAMAAEGLVRHWYPALRDGTAPDGARED